MKVRKQMQQQNLYAGSSKRMTLNLSGESPEKTVRRDWCSPGQENILKTEWRCVSSLVTLFNFHSIVIYILLFVTLWGWGASFQWHYCIFTWDNANWLDTRPAAPLLPLHYLGHFDAEIALSGFGHIPAVLIIGKLVLKTDDDTELELCTEKIVPHTNKTFIEPVWIFCLLKCSHAQNSCLIILYSVILCFDTLLVINK